MNSMVTEALTAILRHFLTLAAGYFVTHGIWTQQNATDYVAAAALFLAGWGWSLWQKYAAQKAIVTALAMPSGSTIHELNAVLKEK